jgi:streptogramin lyase
MATGANKIHTGSRRDIAVRKVPADSVPYGSSISTHGNYVWAAYEGDELIAIAPTAAEARGKYRDVLRQRGVAKATPTGCG